jgi:beta-lactamase class D
MTGRAKELVKLLERLIKQDHLYSDEQLKQMKSQLRVIKEELVVLEAKTSKGFGK